MESKPDSAAARGHKACIARYLCRDRWTALKIASVILMLSALVLVLAEVLTKMGLSHSKYVSLDYATYRGTTQASVPGVSQWLGMRFAAPPVGQLRFQAPQDPHREAAIAAATKFGPGCLSTDATKQPDKDHDEDCLYINVFSPTQANRTSRLPVVFHMAGGGFNSNANPYLDGAGLVKAANYGIIVVTANYRVGPYGFLGGDEVGRSGSYNNGLKDERKALEWTKKYISTFGGNPDQVIIGGESAGGASTALQLTAYGGTGEQLFAGAIASSVSSPTMYNISASQFAYDYLAEAAGCKGSLSFTCLQSLPAAQLQKVGHRTPLPGRTSDPIFLWGPLVDFDLVPDYTYNLFSAGKFFKVPTIMGSDLNDGTVFTPRQIDSYDACHAFVGDNFPLLNSSSYAAMDRLWPIDAYPQRFPDAGSFWRQCSQVYGDMRYKCPSVNFVSAMADHGVPTWEYRWAALDPGQNASGLGVPHTIEANAIWANPVASEPPSYRPGGLNADMIPESQAYYTSFIRSLDPNVHKRAQDPMWERFNSKTRQILWLDTNSTRLETQDASEQATCRWAGDMGNQLQM